MMSIRYNTQKSFCGIERAEVFLPKSCVYEFCLISLSRVAVNHVCSVPILDEAGGRDMT